jgi:Mg2+ and Co2+ transporter CorA
MICSFSTLYFCDCQDSLILPLLFCGFAHRFFLDVSKEDLGFLDKLFRSSGFINKNNNRALLQFLSYISKSFGFSVNRIWKSVKKDRKNLIKLNSKNILDLVKQEDILNDYLFSFSSLIDVYTKVIKSRTISFGDDEKDFVEDLVVDLNQTFNSCKSALKTITNMRDYYSTTLSNNLNNTLKILTIFTVFLTIPTLLASLYGMNILAAIQQFSVFVWVMIRL